MENASGVQQLFFQHIKTGLPPHLSLVDEIAGMLNISTDSAYRRIRGEKPISFDELRTLCSHYKISLDQLFHIQSDSFIFTGKLADNTTNFFGEWLTDVLQKYSYIHGFERKHIYFVAKDIPLQSFFQFKELARFKFFLWMRTFMRYEDLKNKKFSIQDPYPEFEDIGRKIIQVTNKIPTTEIWGHECINATIRQIEFYREANVFQSKHDVLIVYERLEELMNHFEKQSEIGKKFSPNESPLSNAGDYDLYLNELFLGDNSVVAEVNNNKIIFLNHNVLHIVSTHDERFTSYMYDRMMNMLQKSTKMSLAGEKTRSRFFNSLREKIEKRKLALQHG